MLGGFITLSLLHARGERILRVMVTADRIATGWLISGPAITENTLSAFEGVTSTGRPKEKNTVYADHCFCPARVFISFAWTDARAAARDTSIWTH